MTTLLAPEACQSMADIRHAIDSLDEQIITLLGQRYRYVLAAAPLKTSVQSVRAEERLRQVLAQRREWAQTHGLNPDAIERLYSDLIEHFIAEELRHWQAAQSSAPCGTKR
ncbi:isochorismate pyruvate lyase [Atopomonas hussainii]|uniref:chorismate mutase n=1 Tax=Atopomonas hussainii TaxID=1429083 RepID=A0A1H7NYN1_9GAMM|nr:isochorismate lyase [Atopomonas hussainii]SEL28374.1 isochorismate pyruvate lyase [Atopomonas hussainii]